MAENELGKDVPVEGVRGGGDGVPNKSDTPPPAAPPLTQPGDDIPPVAPPTNNYPSLNEERLGGHDPEAEEVVTVEVLVDNLGPSLYRKGNRTSDPAIVALLDDGSSRVRKI
ncbi:MAG: hypothetical protein WCD76_07055 [Pyrinomonadaceae bacterium]